MIARVLLAGLALASLLGSASAAPQAALPLRLVAQIPLPDDATRFDYADVDPERNQLFLAHLAASNVVVIDLRTNAVRTIPDVAKVHGVLVIPGRDRVYASATGTNEVVAIDTRTLSIVARIPGGTYPDGMAYDPRGEKLYVSDERGATETVIDTRTNRRIATIPLGGDVGNSQYDAARARIYVNVQGRGDLAVIDPKTDAIVARYPIPGCASNHGLLLDDEHARAYIACEGNAKLVVFDLNRNVVVGSLPLGDDPDVLAYDRILRRLYVAAESGIVSVFRARPGGLDAIGSGVLGKNAHVVAVDQRTHRVYFPVFAASDPTLFVMVPAK